MSRDAIVDPALHRARRQRLLNALGELALAQGDRVTARTYFAQVRDLLADKVAPTHVDLVQALRRLA